MSLATKSTRRQSTNILSTEYQNRQNQGGGGVSAALTKGKDLKIPSNFRLGDHVVIFAIRDNRKKYNGKTGVVCAVVWPNDRERSIIYVKVAGMQPCFFESELQRVPQTVEEVQPCE